MNELQLIFFVMLVVIKIYSKGDNIMPIERPIEWVNNVTRLNAANMNTISKAFITIGDCLWGPTDGGGLTADVNRHQEWFVGNNESENSGIFKQIGHLGMAILSPQFCNDLFEPVEGSTYNYKGIQEHPIRLEVPNVEWNNTTSLTNRSTSQKNIGLKVGDTKRSLIGPPIGEVHSVVDEIVQRVNSATAEIIHIGNIYKKTGIFFNNGSEYTPYIKAELGTSLTSSSLTFSAAHSNFIGNLYVKDEFGAPLQGTDGSSVVVKDTFDATTNALKLALIAEVKARQEGISNIEADYLNADESLRKDIVDVEIAAINNSLNFFSEEPVVTAPSATMGTSVSNIEVGTTFKTVSVSTLSFNPGSYSYGCVAMSGNSPITDAKGYYQYQSGTGLTSSSYTYSCSGVIDCASGTDKNLTVSDKTLTYSSGYVMLDQDKLVVRCNVTHNAGALPVDSIGRVIPAKRINGNTLNLSKTVTAYRKPFWGYKLTSDALPNPQNITSAQIRSLQKWGTNASGLPTTYEVPANTKQIFFAAKQGTKTNLTIKNTTKEPATTVACSKISVDVADARGGSTNTTPYDVWYVNPDSAFTTLTKLQLTWS